MYKMPENHINTSRYVMVTMKSRIDIQYSKIDIYFYPRSVDTPRTIALSPYRTECSDSPLRPGLRGAMRGWARLGEAAARVARARDSGGSHGDTVASVTSADTLACQTCAVTRPIKVCLEMESVLASYWIQLFREALWCVFSKISLSTTFKSQLQEH